MSALPDSLIYTQDLQLLQRVSGYLYARSAVRHITDFEELDLTFHPHSSILLFADLCGAGCLRMLEEIKNRFPSVLVVALGAPRSEPALQAASLGVYAIESPDVDRLRLQTLFDQAQSHLHLLGEIRILKESLKRIPVAQEAPRENINPSLYHFSSAFRRFDNFGIMLESIVEGVAACARVSRVSVFTRTPSEVYAYRAGVKCMAETRALEFGRTHPFVQWLQVHAHSISVPMLRHIESVDERLLIERALEQAGAEAILPLFGREELIGWLCIGRPSSGAPLKQRDIEELTQLAEQVSVTIENSLLHESIALEKTLAENLLQAIPVGIVATGADGTVRWFNSGAEKLLNAIAADVIGRPIEKLSTYLASLLRRCVSGETAFEPGEWTEPCSRRKLSIQVRCLRQDGQCVGAMAVLNDLTEECILREKQNNLERVKFWNELASAISHAVRNPLVAISTFSQLLPERYADEEFREQFRDLTTLEVNRLNGMIDQLDEYANPPQLQFDAVDVAELIERAISKAREKEGAVECQIDVELQPSLPAVRGDANVLADSISCLLVNAFAAVADRSSRRITLRISRGEIGIARLAVVIEAIDNGIGIPEDIQSKIFSPFCTTKPRGVGLGLPVVRRTMIDHGGLIAIQSSEAGTTVSLTLPAAGERQRPILETTADFRR